MAVRHVRFGSKADIHAPSADVRFTPRKRTPEPARVLPSTQQLRQLGDIRRDNSCLIFAERFGSPRTCRSLFLLHEAQIADNGEQLLSDGCFGAAGKIEKGIKFILVRLHLR